MIPFFDHHSAKQSLPIKPIHYGFKMFCLNQLLGCCFQFEPYQGKSTVQSETMQAFQGKFGLEGATVLSLFDTMDEACGVLYLDSFFTSPKLFREMPDRNIGAAGTFRKNRVEKCPLDINMKKKPRGTTDIFHQQLKPGNTLVLSCQGQWVCHYWFKLRDGM